MLVSFPNADVAQLRAERDALVGVLGMVLLANRGRLRFDPAAWQDGTIASVAAQLAGREPDALFRAAVAGVGTSVMAGFNA